MTKALEFPNTARQRSLLGGTGSGVLSYPARSIITGCKPLPIEGCWVQGRLAGARAGRRGDRPTPARWGLLLFGDYLVDHYCLGVKDCYTPIDIPVPSFMSRLCRPSEGGRTAGDRACVGTRADLWKHRIRSQATVSVHIGVFCDSEAGARPAGCASQDRLHFRQGWQALLRLRPARQRKRHHATTPPHRRPGNFDYLAEIDPALGERLFLPGTKNRTLDGHAFPLPMLPFFL